MQILLTNIKKLFNNLSTKNNNKKNIWKIIKSTTIPKTTNQNNPFTYTKQSYSWLK